MLRQKGNERDQRDNPRVVRRALHTLPSGPSWIIVENFKLDFE